jgi:hypothetical protein
LALALLSGVVFKNGAKDNEEEEKKLTVKPFEKGMLRS